MRDKAAFSDVVSRALGERDTAVKQRDALLAALKAVEWGEESGPCWRGCPSCHNEMSAGHEGDCLLAAAIARCEPTPGGAT